MIWEIAELVNCAVFNDATVESMKNYDILCGNKHHLPNVGDFTRVSVLCEMS